MSDIGEKVAYVKRAGQTRDHGCHWPGCHEQVPPAKWGCTAHWYRLPQNLRNAIWKAFKPGQEVDMTPSRTYLQVAREVQNWIRENYPDRGADYLDEPRYTSVGKRRMVRR